MADLYIPQKIKVGFQERSDTFTKKLAYVICYDTKGKLRKEGSWESWRDKKIPAEEFDNTPHSGFILNKGHTRYNYSHFGSNRRTVVRVYDDRGIEFEITAENCIALLMETTCSKRVIDGECVYAWKGKDLVLLPVGSESYKEATVSTARQGMKISAKDLKPGCSYTTKKGDEVIYIGRYNWFEWGYGSSRICKKSHIFAHAKKPMYGGLFFPKDGAAELASLNNPDPVANYAELVDEFNSTINSSTIVSYEERKCSHNLDTKQDIHYGPSLKKQYYGKIDGDRVDFYRIDLVNDHKYENSTNSYTYTTLGYLFVKEGSIYTKTNKKVRESAQPDPYYNHFNRPKKSYLTAEEVLHKIADLADIYMVLESGKKLQIKNFSDYGG